MNRSKSPQTPLWQPSPFRIADANLTRFMTRVKASAKKEIEDYESLYRWSVEEPADFWNAVWDFGEIVAARRGDVVVEAPKRFPGARWYPDARLNFAENLLRQQGSEPAIIFRNEQGEARELSWDELHGAVSKLQGALIDLGVQAGDRIAAVAPNIPESVIAMLAVASIGAIWASCSPDFGVDGVVDRFGQIEPKILFAVDGYSYNGKRYELIDKLKRIREAIPSLETVILMSDVEGKNVFPESEFATLASLTASRRPQQIRFTSLPFNHPLYILFSSGTTGPPKCIVHGAGGTLIQHLKEHLLHCDIHPGERVFYFTTCGWMMWNWLVSALACRATLVLYDGAPFFPEASALFDVLDEAHINVFGVSAKYLEAVKKAGLAPLRSHRLNSLMTLLSTGSPLAPESFDFVYQSVKHDVCLSSISGGTEIVSCFVLGAPILPVYRGEIQCPGLGMSVEVFDERGRPLRSGKGELVCTAPFPSMPLGFWNDPLGHQFHATYFKKYPGVWCHGDYAEWGSHGGMIIHGRSDTVLNPAGVRIGTGEIYRQVGQFPEILESLVIGQDWQDDVRVVLFVCLREGTQLEPGLAERIRDRIRERLSPRHVPAKIIQVPDIPRTRSGKIVELAVREVVHGRPVRNVHALENPQALAFFRNRPELTT